MLFKTDKFKKHINWFLTVEESDSVFGLGWFFSPVNF